MKVSYLVFLCVCIIERVIFINIFDLHCDTLDKLLNESYSFYENDGHISEKGILKGEYIAQCFAIYTPVSYKGSEATKYVNKCINVFKDKILVSKFINYAWNKKTIKSNMNSNFISALLTVENAEFLNNNVDNISLAEENKIRILGLVHNSENCIGFPNSNVKYYESLGLKEFGKQVVDALNYTNIYVDVSHLNRGGFNDVVKISKNPIIATHSACKNIYNHKRNLSDEQIKSIANSGGVIGIVFYSHFLNGGNNTELDDLLAHISHLINIGGEDAVSVGTDFDGMDCNMFINNCGEMQVFANSLIKKYGFNIAEKICYNNALRIF